MSNYLTISGISIQNGEHVGCLFYTGKLFFGVYNQTRGVIVWDDGGETETDFEILLGIERWLER